jgi:hypothetical protein
MKSGNNFAINYRGPRLPSWGGGGGGGSQTFIYVTFASSFFSENENYIPKKWQVIFLQESLACYYSDHGV